MISIKIKIANFEDTIVSVILQIFCEKSRLLRFFLHSENSDLPSNTF